jgi:hypothetical protein
MSQNRDALPDDALPPSLIAQAERSRLDIIHGLKATEDLAMQLQAWRAGDLYRVSGTPRWF